MRIESYAGLSYAYSKAVSFAGAFSNWLVYHCLHINHYDRIGLYFRWTVNLHQCVMITVYQSVKQDTHNNCLLHNLMNHIYKRNLPSYYCNCQNVLTNRNFKVSTNHLSLILFPGFFIDISMTT